MSKKNKKINLDDDNIPDNVLDPDLYREAQAQANESYSEHSAYKSMFLVRMYKKLGGEYAKPTKKNPRKEKLDTWLDEEWIQITPYLEEKEKVPCGRTEFKEPNACRPLKNISGKPKNATIQNIIDKFGKKEVMRLTKLKLDDMGGRLDWDNGTFTSSQESKARIKKREEKKKDREDRELRQKIEKKK
tara:strand:+ start:330 stop:893 length:564 start_codon:yes stop_codon:yes gene_type:complete